MMKFYRWFDFYKWDLLIVLSALSILIWIVSCQPTNHTDIQFKELKKDTTKNEIKY